MVPIVPTESQNHERAEGLVRPCVGVEHLQAPIISSPESFPIHVVVGDHGVALDHDVVHEHAADLHVEALDGPIRRHGGRQERQTADEHEDGSPAALPGRRRPLVLVVQPGVGCRTEPVPQQRRRGPRICGRQAHEGPTHPAAESHRGSHRHGAEAGQFELAGVLRVAQVPSEGLTGRCEEHTRGRNPLRRLPGDQLHVAEVPRGQQLEDAHATLPSAGLFRTLAAALLQRHGVLSRGSDHPRGATIRRERRLVVCLENHNSLSQF
mmetsp:Transcript_156609/g.502777  ORF Transcript_156609/g.502777 Transcript_156609/m.502777 type:complete len:266 (+) Transcript_156609:1895-2692(+)